MAVGTALGVIPEPRSWPHLGFVAITVAFGLETLRAMLSLLVYVLREGYGWDAIQVGILALVIFSTGFQAGPLTRRLGTGATLAIAGGGVGVLQLVAQIWPVYPVVDLGLSIAGAFLFIVFLFAMVEHARGKDGVGTAGCGLAFLLGVSLDTFLMGAFSTWEPFWRFGIGSMWAVTLMVMAQMVCLVYVLGFGSLISSPIRPQSQWSDVNPPGIGSSLPWLALGPIIFLQLQVFQNIAGFAAVTGWTLPQAFLGIVISNVVGLLVAALVVSKPSCGAWGPALLLGALLTGTLGIGSSLPNIAAGALIVGQACLSALLIIVFSAFETTGKAADTGTGRQPEQGGTQESGAQPSSAFHGIGMVLLMALLFGYYASLELEMPFSREMLLPAAGVIVAVAALWASVSSQPSGISYFPVWRPAAFAAVFAIAPVVMLLTWQAPQQVEGNGYPVRVMTYNLHNGFNTDGLLDLEELADVIGMKKPTSWPYRRCRGVGSSTALPTCCCGCPGVSTCPTSTALPWSTSGAMPYSHVFQSPIGARLTFLHATCPYCVSSLGPILPWAKANTCGSSPPTSIILRMEARLGCCKQRHYSRSGTHIRKPSCWPT